MNYLEWAREYDQELEVVQRILDRYAVQLKVKDTPPYIIASLKYRRLKYLAIRRELTETAGKLKRRAEGIYEK